ncbi:hypothetical protein [Salinicola halophilus]|uniref:hypothetical protein n=1 Tax=Salinicola halophilus TaxID=184065 RepID=UPI000DA186A7|nr:hypothetical protein [Salinicola halophilus]
MKIRIIPQRSDLGVKYSATEDVLTVEVGDRVDTFDFTDAPDGTFDEFTSETLPVCPILRARKDGDALTVWALGWYGPAPERDHQQTPVRDDEGEIVDFIPEPLEQFQARLDEWQALTQEREVTL